MGYEVDVTLAIGDWGVDVFFSKGGEKIAVQEKNYETCRTKTSRKDIMELHGAKDYFDCQRAIVVYNGRLAPDAEMVAKKLGIECVFLEYDCKSDAYDYNSVLNFDACWAKYVKPLVGVEIETLGGVKYQILDVTHSKINFLSSTGKQNNVKVDVFKGTFY